jgi:hypothetical protein
MSKNCRINKTNPKLENLKLKLKKITAIKYRQKVKLCYLNLIEV